MQRAAARRTAIQVDAKGKKKAAASYEFDMAVQDGILPPAGYLDPLGIKPEDLDAFGRKRTVELQNGRLGMLAIAGFNAQELTDGKPIWPIHGLDSKASAAELDSHIHKGMDLVKEMGQMMADTAPHY